MFSNGKKGLGDGKEFLKVKVDEISLVLKYLTEDNYCD